MKSLLIVLALTGVGSCLPLNSEGLAVEICGKNNPWMGKLKYVVPQMSIALKNYTKFIVNTNDTCQEKRHIDGNFELVLPTTHDSLKAIFKVIDPNYKDPFNRKNTGNTCEEDQKLLERARKSIEELQGVFEKCILGSLPERTTEEMYRVLFTVYTIVRKNYIDIHYI